MMRRYGVGAWLVVFALVATFVDEPKASFDAAVDTFQAVGEFGGTLITDFRSGE